MPFEIKPRQNVENPDVTFLDCSGPCKLGEGTRALNAAIRAELDMGHKNLLLNFTDVTTIDAPGCGELVSGLGATSKAQGKLRMLIVPKPENRFVRDALSVVGLSQDIGVYANEPAAVTSFSQQAEKVGQRR